MESAAFTFRTLFVRIWLILLPGIALQSITAQEQKHSDPSKSCVSGQCHASVVKHKHLHGPLAVGQCVVCHLPTPGGQPKCKIAADQGSLCATCHKPVNAATMPGMKLHDPVEKGKCLSCHDPHGSEETYQIRKTPAAKLCYDCHKPVVTRKVAHQPVAKGDCLACHRPHGNKAKNLLDATGFELCRKCHELFQSPGKEAKPPAIHLASENCSRCHRPHDSNLPALLSNQPVELCLASCHKEVKEKTETSEFKHEPMIKGVGCAECHKAHNPKFGRLLRKPDVDLCFGCHEKLQAQIASAKFKHRPVADRSCSSCHAAHGSSYGKLLFADYPSETSVAYAPSRYDLCFSCHREAMVRDRYTDGVTEFRNGRFNLHYLHVNNKSNGLSCGTCHDAHAADLPKLVRSSAPFGNWKIPIQYKKNQTGGSCVSGCHTEYIYDRVNPVQLKADEKSGKAEKKR